jgi:hypothetical protein
LRLWRSFPAAVLLSAVLAAAPQLSSAACGVTNTVRKPAGGTCVSIQECVDLIPAAPLAGDWCVNVDSSTYNEQVTVQGKDPNGWRIIIQADPALVSTRPTVSPPMSSGAAFRVLNASVTLAGFMIAPGVSVPFGVLSSSSDVAIDSVTVVGASHITIAGMQVSSWTSVTRSSVIVEPAAGLWIVGEGASVSDSTAAASGAGRVALRMDASSGTVLRSRFVAPGGWAAYVRGSANAVVGSTFNSNGALYPAVVIENGYDNSIAASSITNTSGAAGAADALFFQNVHRSRVVGSTLSARGLGSAVELSNSSYNVISASYLSYRHSGDPPCATAAYLVGVGNLVEASTVASNSASCSALSVIGSSFTLQDSLLTRTFSLNGGWSTVLRSTVAVVSVSGSSVTFDSVFAGGIMQFGSDYPTIARSTVAVNSASPALQFLGSSAAVSGSLIMNLGTGDAVQFVNGHHGSVVGSTVVSASGYGLYILNSADDAVRDSYFQGTSGLRINGGARVSAVRSRFAGSGAAGIGLYHTSGSNPSVSSCVFSGGSGGHGLSFAGESGSTVRLDSVTVLNGWRGLTISPLNGGAVANFSVAATSLAFLGPVSVVNTAVNLGVGTLVSTFSYVRFEDGNTNPNVDASLLAPGARLTFCGTSGAKSGPAFEVDPGGRVDWAAACWAPRPYPVPPGCVGQASVRQDGAVEFLGIQQALDAQERVMSSDVCVVVRDTETYAEQVTVQGFTTNGFRVRVFSDPSFVSSAPVVSPPANSTAAFVVRNDSVTLGGFNVLGAAPVPYGVLSSSPFLVVSGVNVDSAGRIGAAGISVSSWTTLSASSVTVQSAHGLLLTGTGSLVSGSTFTSRAAGFSAVLLDGASTNTLAGVVASGDDGDGVLLAGGGWNVLRDLLASSSRFKPALSLASSSSNTIESGRFQSSASSAVVLASSHFNAFRGSTVTAAAAGVAGFLAGSSSGSAVVGVVVEHPAGHGVLIQGGSHNRVESSRITSGGSGFLGLWLLATSSAVVTGSAVEGSTAVLVQASTGAVIEDSALTAAAAAGHGLRASDGLVNLTLATNVFTGGPQGYGVWLDSGIAGILHLSSGAVRGSNWGMAFGAGSAAFAVSSVTLADLPAGATAVVFFGGVVVTTLTGVDFGDFAGADVNGAGLGAGSRVTMRSAWGQRAGQAFEVDPGEMVDWPEIPFIMRGPYPLVVFKTGPGVVMSSPAGIRCGDVCSALFRADTPVVLMTQRPVTVRFSGWGGDCDGSGGCLLVMTDSMTVTATFNQPKEAVSSYPNPFTHDGAKFAYQLAKPSDVEIRIFTLTGRPVAVITDRGKAAGFGETRWDGRDSEGREVARGIYQYRFKAVAGPDEWVRVGSMAKAE